jgi:putative tricarboxylic transport membrane protein
LKLSKDGWGGLAVLAASLFLFALTLGLKDNPLVPIGPGFYPRIVLGVTAAFAFALVVADLWGPGKRSQAEKLNYLLVVEMFALFGLYCNALLDVPRGWKGATRVLAVALITTVIVYYAFERYLTVLLPRGRWTNF